MSENKIEVPKISSSSTKKEMLEAYKAFGTIGGKAGEGIEAI